MQYLTVIIVNLLIGMFCYGIGMSRGITPLALLGSLNFAAAGFTAFLLYLQLPPEQKS